MAWRRLLSWQHERALPSAAPDPLDQSLRLALAESRTRYKRLVELSSDFAFETDAAGRFTFVSPKGFLGYTADELVGRKAAGFLIDSAADVAATFTPRRAIADVEVWVRTAVGGEALLVVTAEPLNARSGPFSGARGIARDITAADAQIRALARADIRERLLFRILRAAEAKIGPESALDAVASEIGTALGSVCRFVPIGTSEPFSNDAGGATITVPVRYNGQTSGHLVLSRKQVARAFDKDERELASALAGHVGILVAQAEAQKELTRLARIDPLTGLLNRGAFMNEAGRRFARIQGGQGQACLVLIDLDNFKPVNDRLGHAAGDRALMAIAKHLTAAVRGADLAARLGGDEFVLWLEGADGEAGETRARTLAAAAATLFPEAIEAGIPLGLSAGVAWAVADTPMALPELLQHADEALYAAKRSGKGRAVRAGKAA